MTFTTPAYARYLKRFTIGVALLFTAVAACNFVVDPYNQNGFFDLSLDKERVALTLNQRLYKLLEFTREPRASIIVGDSRSRVLDAAVLKEMGYGDWYNFAYGGASLDEALDTIAFANEHIDLEKIVVGISFSSFNGNAVEHKLRESENLSRNWLAYYTSYSTLSASLQNLYAKFTGQLWVRTTPPLEREAWWRYRLAQHLEYLRSRREPRLLKSKLERTLVDLAAKGVDVVLYLPPEHADLRALNQQYAAIPYLQFKRYVSRLGEVVDFDIDNAFTMDRVNFTDPHHISSEVLPQIVDDLLGATRRVSVKYRAEPN